jgi:tetratricopeptide (TPR) repeat protein
MAKIALLIGVSEYEPGLNPLPAAVKDLDAMKEVLQHPEMGGFAESDIVLLPNPERQAMEESIETLFANRHRDDLLLLFFSGHGIKDDSGRLYLGTSKTRKNPQGELVRSSAVAANFIHENMSRSRSKRQVVILDSCFSGAFADGLSAKDDGTVDIRTQLGGEGRAILTSSSSTQYSFEQEGEALSLYTRFLIDGIKTGEADLDGDDVVSIDELHEYASRKVREVKPEMRPEIYAVREGFKIRLSKVPQGDPRQRYQKEVARCGRRGELTIVSRSILDTWRLKLELSVEEATALEDEILEPYRRGFQQKLQRYEQTVTDVLQRDGTIHDNTRQELQSLQQVLELRNEDTVPIEARVAANIKTHKQNLETYKQSFSDFLRQEYPLGEASRSRLHQMRQQLALSDVDVAPIEAQITAEIETYQRNLQQYELVFLTATQQEYPLSAMKRNELRQHQSNLGLSDVEIAPIEAKVTTQIETYQQKLQQYEEAFASATQRKHQPSEANFTQLRQTWQTLGLSAADVQAIEAPIMAQIATHQANLRQYEQAFVDATEQEYPLSRSKRSELRQRQQALGLSDEDIAPIENAIEASIEDHLKKLQQYEQVFSDSIQFEFPVSELTREELRRFQQILELGDEEVSQLEAKVVSQAEQGQHENEQSDTSPNSLSSPEVDTQEAKSLDALERYEIEVVKYINAGISPKDYVAHKKLNVLRNALKLSLRETEAIESRLTRATSHTRDKSQSDEEAIEFRLTGATEAKISNALKQYEMEVIKYINAGISLKDYVAHRKLNVLRNALKLSLRETEAIEMRLMGRTQSPTPPHSSIPALEPTRSSQSSTAGEFRWIEEPIQPKSDSFIDKHSATIRLLGSLFPIVILGSIVLLSGKQKTTPPPSVSIASPTPSLTISPTPSPTILPSLSAQDKSEDFLKQGLAKLNKGDYKESIKDFDEAIRLKPDYADAYCNRGRAKYYLDDKGGAIKDLDEAIRLKPDYSLAYNGRGISKFYSGNKQEAMKDYDKAIQINKNWGSLGPWIAHWNRGRAKLDSGDNQEAIQDFDEAIRLKSDSAEVYNDRGLVKSILDDKSGAIKDFDEAIRLKPNLANAYYLRGNTKSNSGDKQGAIKDLDEAIRLEPDYAGAYNNRGIAKSALDDKEGAIKDYTKSIELKNSELHLPYNNRGTAKLALGDQQGAIKDFDEAIRLKPDFAIATKNLGNAKSALGDKQGAIQDYQDAAKLYQQQGKTEDYRNVLSQIEKLKN